MSAYQSQHRYEPLSSPDAFRLLLLEPSVSRTAQLRGSLLNTTLAACDYDLIDPYTALSYVWGPPEKPCRISLEGHDGNLFAITQSLDDALRDLRDVTRVRRLWADALCIDQLNIPERNVQVSLMGRIYSTAHSTVIHLGILHPRLSGVLTLPRDSTSDSSEGGAAAADSDLVAQARRGLLAKPWFKRVWVLQELVLSKDPWVQCGNERIRWNVFCRHFIGNSASASQGLDAAAVADEEISVLSQMNSSWVSHARLPLHRAAQARRGLGATDPRDFVYANFGIISDLAVVKQYLHVDYSMSVAETFGSVARYMFDQLGVEVMMSHVDDGRPEDSEQVQMDKLPSWAPDWTRTASNTASMYKDNHLNHMRLRGIHHAFADGDFPLVLGHIGYEVDVIESLHVMRPKDESLTLPMEYREARADLLALYQNAYASGDKFGSYRHVPLKGKEAEHEALCNMIGSIWARLLGYQGDESSQTNSGRVSFAGSLVQWISARAKERREFVGSGARGLIKLLYSHFERTRGRSELDGRCLASTRGGRLGVVPQSAAAGDRIVYLAGSETAVVLRQASRLLGHGEVERALLRSLRHAGCGTVTVVKPNGEEEFWRVPEKADIPVSHFEVVGEGYLDDCAGWTLKHPPMASDLRVFALH
ncbi:Heterokaryon incompatibility protein 6, OR allele [Colletotrichum tanaceti]|uniref:Heterokaryon incompatibility protein 6, OR allele n=1 Tax=Colletotrichum tanaceti TaxID=1306861 RepID=A0A4U6XDB2_9PEZI|nr:Heterokaryon incompatibility protein 6, OR allele [Colletotrichum tanaceti]TKW51827.1 Heterokaryon incompatibility protein 6, OR allele [Colletotrichum tanaceti]